MELVVNSVSTPSPVNESSAKAETPISSSVDSKLPNWNKALTFHAPHLSTIETTKIVNYAQTHLGLFDIRFPAAKDLPRTLEYLPDGKIIVHLTRDAEVEWGSEKVIKWAFDLNTGAKFISSRLKKPAKGKPTEVSNMELLKGKAGFVQLVSYREYPSRKHGKAQRIVSEYCNMGDLLNAYNSHLLSLEDRKTIFIQLIERVCELHSMGYLHRDLKPENIFLHRDKKGIQAVVGDLSFMCKIDGPGFSGSLLYLAPEFLNKLNALLDGPKSAYDDNKNSIILTQAADVWALGCILYFIIYNDIPPWHDKNTPEIVQIPDPENVSSPHYLVWLMLQIIPENRITAKEAKEHLAKIDWDVFHAWQ